MTDTTEPYYPEWFTTSYFDADVDWGASTHTTMDRFLALYTLHDSIWIDLRLDTQYDGRATLVFRFDAFWTEGRIPHPGSAVAEWPVLFIRLPKLHDLALSDYERVADSQRVVGSVESSDSGPGLVSTLFIGVYDEKVRLTHTPEIELLCMDREGNVLPFQDL